MVDHNIKEELIDMMLHIIEEALQGINNILKGDCIQYHLQCYIIFCC